MYSFVKTAHIIFIVTWFAGLFYIVRLFVYNTEAGGRPDMERDILRRQYAVMIRRLWWGITWPSALLTLLFGPWMAILYGSLPAWLLVKIGFVLGLYGYHFLLHRIYLQQREGIFRYSSFRLRLWNELATVFLVCIVSLAVAKAALGWLWGLAGLVVLLGLIFAAATIYKKIRTTSTP